MKAKTRTLFNKYQKPLLKLANNSFGRKFLGIDKEVKEKIVSLAPDSYTVKRGARSYESVFRCYPLFAKKLYYAIASVDILEDLKSYAGLGQYKGLLNYCGLFEQPRLFPQIFLASGTFYPDASNIDGVVYRTANDESWATIRAGAGVTATKSPATSQIWTHQRGVATNHHNLNLRSIFLFGTGDTIPGARIDSGTLSLYGYQKVDDVSLAGAGDAKAVLVSSSPASDNGLVAADYAIAGFGSTALSDNQITYNSWSTVGYNAFVLNSSGLDAVSTSGATKLGILSGFDFNNSFSVYGGGSDNQSIRVDAYFSGETGTTKDPKLAVAWTVMGGSFLYNFV